MLPILSVVVPSGQGVQISGGLLYAWKVPMGHFTQMSPSLPYPESHSASKQVLVITPILLLNSTAFLFFLA